jgi:hypothetical protein
MTKISVVFFLSTRRETACKVQKAGEKYLSIVFKQFIILFFTQVSGDLNLVRRYHVDRNNVGSKSFS